MKRRRLLLETKMKHRRLIILACSALVGMLWIGHADYAWGDELDQCISSAKKTNLSCWNRCDDEDRNCIADCDADFEARKQQCRANVRANASSGASDSNKAPLSGATKTGQGGCYFGECPPDLDQRIEASSDEEEPPQRKPQRRPQREDEEQPTQRQTFPPPAQVQMTRICQTPAFWCTMYVAGPVNTACWCANAFGTANGVTIPER
jgi:hypothetical protein